MTNPIKLKTSANDKPVAAYIASVDAKLQADARALLDIFSNVTKTKPRMWGASIVGFGEYTYYRSNGDVGQFMATGFSIRKSGPVLYIMPGYTDYTELMKQLGPHKRGKSCLYIKHLEDIHLPTLKKLIRVGLRDLKKTHEVQL